MDMLESVARAICLADGVDPEHLCYGMGRLIPKGEVWPAWKVRVPQAEAAIDVFEEFRVSYSDFKD